MRRMPFAEAARHTASVPSTLTRSIQARPLRPIHTAAAAGTTASHPATAPATDAGSSSVRSDISTGRPSRASRFEDALTPARTAWPASRSARTTLAPSSPVAPVTSTRTGQPVPCQCRELRLDWPGERSARRSPAVAGSAGGADGVLPVPPLPPRPDEDTRAGDARRARLDGAPTGAVSAVQSPVPRMVHRIASADARPGLSADLHRARLGGTRRGMVAQRIGTPVRRRCGAVDPARIPDASVPVPPDTARPVRDPVRVLDPRRPPRLPRGPAPLGDAADRDGSHRGRAVLWSVPADRGRLAAGLRRRDARLSGLRPAPLRLSRGHPPVASAALSSSAPHHASLSDTGDALWRVQPDLGSRVRYVPLAAPALAAIPTIASVSPKSPRRAATRA